MSSQSVNRKLSAILSADVKGYSLLMGDNEVATIRTLETYREVMAGFVGQHYGRVVDSPGDNLLAEFASVVDAVECAVKIQKELQTRNAELPDNRRMVFRIGINLGDVIQEGGKIYGDGVNIAARLEGLADAGGIFVSGTAYDQVKNKLAVGYEYLGEQTVKNISEPVRIYRVLMEPKAAGTLVFKDRKDAPRHRRKASLAFLSLLIVGAVVVAFWKFYFSPTDPVSPVSSEQPAPIQLPEKPSIAVMPFINMSDDPEQEYFSDGITEDLITDLSRISGLSVIARNAVFIYKGKTVKPEQVGGELGVRYVLEGSVRKAGDRMRITAQLIDATTGYHLWAEKYDRELKDIFSLQDEVTGKIVKALSVKLIEGEEERLLKRDTENLGAYDLALRGWAYFRRSSKEANILAKEMFEQAIELDPGYVSACSGLVWTKLMMWIQGWSQDPQTLKEALELAKKAVSLDGSLPECHLLLGHAYIWNRQHEQAISEVERAIALNPNSGDALASLGGVLMYAGKSEEAIRLIKNAMHLNPNYPEWYSFYLGQAYFQMNMYEEAISALKKALLINPDFFSAHYYLAASYAYLGKLVYARSEAEEILRLVPHFSVEVIKQIPYKDKKDMEHFVEGLRKAGLK